MKYSKYPSYKDSGVVWMGEVPEHWTSIKFKQVVVHKKKITNHKLDCGSISFGTVVYKDNDKIPEETRASYQEVLVGEFLINPLNLNFDLKSLRTALSTLDVVVSTGYIVLQNKSNVEKNYLRWVLHQFDIAHMKTLGAGVRQTVNYTDIGDEYFHMPIISEQQAIANYLDKATVKIDTLILKQKKLIELLKETRQAVISRAVTCGLDSKVPMKNSGVEWLGDIPEHWIITKVKNMLQTPVTDGPHETPEFLDAGVPFVSAEAISKGYINFNKIRGHISHEANKKYSQKYSPRLYDVYMIKSGATTGITAIVDNRTDFNIWSPLAVFRTNKLLKPYYLLNYLRSSNFQKAVELYWTYGTQQNIGMNVLENLYISVPPLQEQQDIASYLDNKTLKIDNLISKASKAIDLLKEKRTALISSAVTGKIDVREIA